MKPGIPWSVKGIEPEVREVAKHAARRAGMTLGEWLNTVILDQSDDPQPGNAPAAAAHEEFFAREASREPERPAPRREENTIRLEDIAHQLSQLAQRERESATILPYESPRGRDQDRESLNRILSRIDSNERQAVEAFTAVNERLSVLGRQIAIAARAPVQTFEKPEDVPGYTALEAAIRNVVEHIEVSERRTRDGLKSMQDRLSGMAERATQPSNADDLLRSAPAFTSLESRIADMANRVQRSESMLQAGIPDLVKKELIQLADRIETVREASESLASHAQTAATGVARTELRDIEARILGVLKEAQAAIGNQSATASDLQRLRADTALLNKRIDDVKQATASDHDVNALRIAVEQLSTRVAQGPDMRPLADMDRRIGELTRKLDQNHAAARSLPQFGELERRIAELDHRLGEAMRLQGDHQAVQALEQQITAVNERVGRTEQQLGHLETMERAIHQLYESLEQSRAFASQTAEDAANRAVDRVLAAQQSGGSSPELRAMEEGLRAVRESAAGAEQRNQETLEAVHETLEQIVNKLAELETAAAGHQLAVNMAHQAVEPELNWQQGEPQAAQAEAPAAAQARFYDPSGAFEEQSLVPQENAAPTEATLEPEAYQEPQVAHSATAPTVPAGLDAPGEAPPGLPEGDDFIAAARRAAHAAAARPNVLHPDVKPQLKAGANSRFRLALPFFKAKEKPRAVTYTGGKPVADTPVATANDNKRKKLVLAGIVLLAAVSAFAFNMLSKPPKQPKQSTAIEAPINTVPAVQSVTPAGQGKTALQPAASLEGREQSDLLAEPASDAMATGSIAAGKPDAILSSIVAEPETTGVLDELPAPEVGPLSLREAAQKGDAKAQFIVASRYLDGQSVRQDMAAAAKWYQQAAAGGLAPAQYRLATLFERGKGVPLDVAKAFLWYERAAEGGNVKAMHNAAVISAGNQAGTPNYDKAFKWFKAAAERGLHDSQFNLAVLYERGLGTRVDKAEASFWYTLAGKQGDNDAAKRGTALAKTLSSNDAASAMARVASWVAEPSLDEANVVAVTNPEWNSPGETLSAVEEPAMPLSDGNSVTEAQQLLTSLGYNVGTPDGRMGSRTANAIRLFQLQSGLKVTGQVTPDLLDAMRRKNI